MDVVKRRMPRNPEYDELTPFGKCLIDGYTLSQLDTQMAIAVPPWRKMTTEQMRKAVTDARTRLRDVVLVVGGIDGLITTLEMPDNPAPGILDYCKLSHKPSEPLSNAARKHPARSR